MLGYRVHPRPEDKKDLGDTTPNKLNDDATAVRTREWVRSLGSILEPAEAHAAEQKRLADRLEGVAARVEEVAAETAARADATDARVEEIAAKVSEAGPSTINNTINYNAPVTNVYMSENALRKRPIDCVDTV